MNRAQVHTLEAVVGAFLLLASVTFAIQMTAVTPLSASTSSQHVENQLQASAQGVLADAVESGELEPALLYWNESTGQFHNTSTNSYYTSKAPPNAFGESLRRAFDSRGIAYNVRLHFYGASGSRDDRRMVSRGAPSDNAVRATRTLLLVDNQTLLDKTKSDTGTPIAGDNYFASDMAPDSPVYNVITVEVVAWRI